MNNHTLQQMTLENIAKACGGTYVGEDALRGSEITGAVIDSRQVKPGYLYIPIRGERVDGHRFIPDVFEKGALAVLSLSLIHIYRACDKENRGRFQKNHSGLLPCAESK